MRLQQVTTVFPLEFLTDSLYSGYIHRLKRSWNNTLVLFGGKMPKIVKRSAQTRLGVQVILDCHCELCEVVFLKILVFWLQNVSSPTFFIRLSWNLVWIIFIIVFDKLRMLFSIAFVNFEQDSVLWQKIWKISIFLKI